MKKTLVDNDFIEIQNKVDDYLKIKKKVKILEAGCGSKTLINFNVETFFVGIDISQKQLDRNDSLDEKIFGDIQTYILKENEYDIIICWDVLEHLKNPLNALKNFSKALKKNGIIILGFPNFWSIKGLITKFTPYWFHIFIHKQIMGRKNAGKEDNGPFYTFMKFSIRQKSIKNFCKNEKMKITFLKQYEPWEQRTLKKKSLLIRFIVNGLGNFLKIISFNKIDLIPSDVMVIIKK
jgi:2-polyprenyl-3-methyl-5-hydroxy-6-metoxy-1,4-benzoquinol methylase